jgi:DNA-binding Xre family transcriptional regulator
MQYDKLKEIMKEQKVSSVDLAKELHIDRTTLYRKINMINGVDFTCTEMRTICLYLNVSSDEVFMTEFFSNE